MGREKWSVLEVAYPHVLDEHEYLTAFESTQCYNRSLWCADVLLAQMSRGVMLMSRPHDYSLAT